MKALNQKSSVMEFVIVVERGICFQIIWSSEEQLANNLAYAVYGSQIGTTDAFHKTHIIELTKENCKKLGLKRDHRDDCIFGRKGQELISRIENLIKGEDTQFDILEVFAYANYKPRYISLYEKDGEYFLSKTARFNKKVTASYVMKGYTHVAGNMFKNPDVLKYFAFMNIDNTASENYRISKKAAKQFINIVKAVQNPEIVTNETVA